jgi:hypothetical protein
VSGSPGPGVTRPRVNCPRPDCGRSTAYSTVAGVGRRLATHKPCGVVWLEEGSDVELSHEVVAFRALAALAIRRRQQ